MVKKSTGHQVDAQFDAAACLERSLSSCSCGHHKVNGLQWQCNRVPCVLTELGLGGFLCQLWKFYLRHKTLPVDRLGRLALSSLMRLGVGKAPMLPLLREQKGTTHVTVCNGNCRPAKPEL